METNTPTSGNKTGGYNYDFLNTPSDFFRCEQCKLPSKEPQQSLCCGIIYCKSCIVDAAIEKCPKCRKEPFEVMPDKNLANNIAVLQVICRNKDIGCEWQGELKTIIDHLGNSDGCRFEVAQCSNGCGEMFQRRFLASHAENQCSHRLVTCRYCKLKCEYHFIEGERHKKLCPKFPLPCPNKCEIESVPRENMEAHRKECPLEIVQCEYYNVGCEERMLRKDLAKHTQEKLIDHLLWTNKKLSSQLSIALAQNEALKSAVYDLATAVSQRNTNDVIDETSKRCVSLAAEVARSQTGDRICPVTIKAANISEMTKKTAEADPWYSHAFFTHNKGYKMCLSVVCCRAGDGGLSVFLHLMKGPHDNENSFPLQTKFKIYLLNQIKETDGECLDYVMTVTYDENTPNHHADRVTNGDKAERWGCLKFIGNEDLKKASPTCQYLKNDCIFLKVNKQ